MVLLDYCDILLGNEANTISKTGAGTSISRMGWADLGIAQFNDMVANAAMIASLNPTVPLIADADTGYGGPIMVSRTITQYARAGVAALHIEDQVQQKRCGHLLGKQLVDRETYYARLRAAVTSRDQIGSDMLIIARTDARQSLGFDEAVERLQGAVDIGVDVVFLEAMTSKEEAAKVCQIFKKTNTPCLLNMVAGGVTPDFSVEEARQMGFKIIIHPSACATPLVRSVASALKELKETGVAAEDPKDPLFGSPRKVFELAGLQECIDLDTQAGGTSYSTAP